MKATNPYAVAGRLNKAFRLIVLLRRWGVTPGAAKLMSVDEWGTVAEIAEVKPPSAETIRITLEKLAELDQSPETM